jgi:hypothetical protein
MREEANEPKELAEQDSKAEQLPQLLPENFHRTGR